MRENEKVYSDGDIENKIIEALNEGKSDRSICNMGGQLFIILQMPGKIS